MLDYEELRVRARRVGPDRFLLLANGPSAAATVVTVEAADPGRLRADFDRLIRIELNLQPSVGTDVRERLRALGRTVFGMLFPEPLAECLPRQHAAAADGPERNRPLRLRFDLPPELQDLPIEALAAPTGMQTLALHSRLSVVRTVAGEAPDLPAADEDPAAVELLVAVASPAGLDPLGAEAEIDRLTKLPKRSVRRTVEPHATRRRIEDWLVDHADRPAAILLIAHGAYDAAGNMGTVYLETEDGGPDPVSAELLSGMLARGRRLRLVVLNLCSGATTGPAEPYSGLAQALIGRGIPAVIGMRAEFTDSAAALFGPKVLAAIAANTTVDEAVVSARQQIHTIPDQTAIEWATPRCSCTRPAATAGCSRSRWCSTTARSTRTRCATGGRRSTRSRTRPGCARPTSCPPPATCGSAATGPASWTCSTSAAAARSRPRCSPRRTWRPCGPASSGSAPCSPPGTTWTWPRRS
ncbi:CHAT domain-containing protein [Catenulispora yoronensis]